MAKRKSRFPSYGLVRGASHAQGGVDGMVAGEQPVELEGGEWIIPKEAVPDYLPVLKQITNQGRAMQQMQNGNSAMDALIASASMENGLTQPKSPMYQDGGEVLPLLQKIVRQAAGENFPASYGQSDRRPGSGPAQFLSERTLGPVATLTGENQGYTSRRTTAGRMDSGEVTGIDEWLQQNLELGPLSIGRRTEAHPDELTNVLYKLGLFGKDMYFDFDKKSKSQKRLLKRFKKETSKEQGGPVNYYQDGGKAEELVKFRSPLLNKQKYTMPDLMALEAGMPEGEMLVGYDDIRDMDSPRVKALQELAGVLGTRIQSETQKTPEYGLEYHLRGKPARSVLGDYSSYGNRLQRTINGIPMIDPVEVRPEYQQGGQIQPRKQQEIRNPQTYNVPIELMGPDTTGDSLQQVLNQMMMRDSNQSINPFTGDSIDVEADSLDLLQKMKKSNMSTFGRKKMQQGGQLGQGQPLERRPSPSEQLQRLEGMEARPQDSLMGNMSEDKRVRAMDRYIIKDGVMSSQQMDIPKLSSAYLQSFGMETPLSKRQNDLLRHRAMSPETLGINPQVQSLLQKALVQRLSGEPI